MSDSIAITDLSPLASLLAQIAQAPPLSALLDQALDAACQLTHADTGVVGIYEPGTDAMRTATYRLAIDTQLKAQLERGDGVGGQVLATGEAVRTTYRNLPRPCNLALLDHEVVGLPLRGGGELLGYLAVSLAPPRKFSTTQMRLLDLVAGIAAIAVDNSHQREREQLSSTRFELIARIAADLPQQPGRDAMLQRAADAIHEVLQFPNVDIPLIDPDDPQTLVVRVRGGSYKNKIQREDRLSIDSGIMGAAVREGRTQLTNDAPNDPRYICPPGVAPAQAEIAVPILSGTLVLGVVNIESNRRFDDLDRRSLEVIADYLAVAIKNAELFEQAGNVAVLAERQRLAHELHDNVTQILSSMSLLSQTLGATWQRSPEEGERRAARLHQLAQTAFAEMRMLLGQLAPPGTGNVAISRKSLGLIGVEVLRDQALPGALTRLLASVVPESVAVKSSFAGYVAQRLDHEEALYRVCQEAVSNTLRHARAKSVRVEAAATATHAVLRIVDDGEGLGTEFRPGVGLGSMRLRIENLGGLFRIAANNPRGTLIEARLPRADRQMPP